MSVKPLGWSLTAQILKFIRSKFDGRPIQVLSLGYTDYMITLASVEQELGPEIAALVVANPDNKNLGKWHNAPSQSVETRSLYRALGFETDFLDIREVRGGELIHDLNDPIPESMIGCYDLVIDSGTIEHCYNVGQVMKNIATALKVGGIVYHGNPMVMINHGFYNFSPQFYYEFYRINGFSLMDLFSIEVFPNKLVVERPDLVARFFPSSVNDRTIQVLAQKNETLTITWPTQTKYVQSPSQLSAS